MGHLSFQHFRQYIPSLSPLLHPHPTASYHKSNQQSISNTNQYTNSNKWSICIRCRYRICWIPTFPINSISCNQYRCIISTRTSCQRCLSSRYSINCCLPSIIIWAAILINQQKQQILYKQQLIECLLHSFHPLHHQSHHHNPIHIECQDIMIT